MHDALRERGGNGTITTGAGAVGAAKAWGKPAPWCDYSGTMEGYGPRGIAVDAGASVVLSFDVARIRRPTRRKGRDLGELTGSINERARIRLNIWSSRRDSLLGGRREGVISEAVDRLRIVVAVDAKSDGRCLWRAEAVYDVAGRDPRRIAAGMMAPLAESIGRWVSRKPIYVE